VITISVKLFAGIKDIVGKDEVELSVADASPVAEALASLAENNPLLRPWKNHVRFAVNKIYVQPDHLLKSRDEVAIIPPVSGG